MSEQLNLLSIEENPAAVEEAMLQEQKNYGREKNVTDLLNSIYLEPNRDDSFARFYRSQELETILKVFDIFQIKKNSSICEIGGGSGFLSLALSLKGFNAVSLLEPSNYFTTGTGYLRSRSDSERISIWNDPTSWHAEPICYDVIITKNCIHHFHNITRMAAIIRQKMAPNALWFSFREWFADSTEEMYNMLLNHPYSQKYRLYEWPYPAYHYVESIEMAGLTFQAALPRRYANDCLSLYSEGEKISEDILTLTANIDRILRECPAKTVRRFWQQVSRTSWRRGGARSRLLQRIWSSSRSEYDYRQPQMMLFRKA